MYVIVAVLVIVIVGAGAYIYTYYGNDETTDPTPTPTPTPNGIADATTLTFSANITSQGQTTEYTWAGKDVQTNPIIRTDFAVYSYFLDSVQQTSFSSIDNGATWTQGDFTTDWPFWGDQWSQDVAALAQWSGSGDYSFTNAQDEAVVLFNIVVNPTIPDSTFEVS